MPKPTLPPIKQHIKDIITKSFIHKSHLKAITTASCENSFTVTFRESGVHTINRVGDGAPMKGHDILEKTIKESSLLKYYPDNKVRKEVIGKLESAGLFGSVGHWDEKKGLVGLHIVGPNEKSEIIRFDINNLDLSLLNAKIRRDQMLLAYTGDYDMHDMLTHRSGRPRTVMADSKEEWCIINSMNMKISKTQKYRENIEYNPIRHGAQVNFVTHMLREEKLDVEERGGFLRAVAEPDFPLAAVSKGKWTIINNIYELDSFYTSIGAVLKETWKPNGVRKFSGDGAYVSLKRV